MKTSEVLRKAGDVLRERGWCQGSFDDEYGHVCPLGAIRDIAEDDWVAIAVPLEQVVGVFPKSADTWNDVPGRTAAEVMIALDAAYVVALQEEGIEPGDVL